MTASHLPGTAPDRGRSRRRARRRRPLACESLEPRIALASFAEVEPNSLFEGARGYYQNLFRAETVEVSARRGSEQDVDAFQFNVVRGATVRIHFDPAPGLSLSYRIDSPLNPLAGAPSGGPLAQGQSEFQFGPGNQVSLQPPPDVTLVASSTGSLVLEVQGGSRITFGGKSYGELVGPYSFRITGLDPHGDARVQVRSTSRRRIEAEWDNSTPKKVPIELFYARGTTPDTILGKSLLRKRTIPITTKLPGPREFHSGGLVLPRRKIPAGAMYVLVMVNRKRVAPEADFTNNLVAVPLAQLI